MDNLDEPREPDVWHLYKQMLLCRLFEKEVKRLWNDGAIPGEMHLSMGEEAIVVVVVDQLVEGDAMALDHRGTAPMLARGIDPVLLLKEFMGRTDGLCKGMGGHMHLFSKEHLIASSGIVGASGPAAVGFALANQRLRPGKISVAFFGEGAINEGMMMEAINLAVVWKLPVMFVCKDNGQAILTPSANVTSGSISDRVRGFGCRIIDFVEIDIENMWLEVHEEIKRLRNGDGPVFVHGYCHHLEGHFLGDAFLKFGHPSKGEIRNSARMVKAFLSAKDAALFERTRRVKDLLGIIMNNLRIYRSGEGDPIPAVRLKLENMDAVRAQAIQSEVENEITSIIRQVVLPTEQGGGMTQ